MIELVDREAPLAQLRRSLEGTVAGQGRILFLSGEAGIGKTRLVQELELTTKDKEVLVLHGRCLSPLGSDPYFPILEALREYSKGQPGPEKVRPTVPMSVLAVGDNNAAPDGKAMPMGLLGIDDIFKKDTTEGSNVHSRIERLWRMDVGRERERTFETISSTILGIAKERPLLLFLDDVQWADSATVNLLVHIARYIKGYRVLILCAYRPEETLDVAGKPHLLREAIRRIDNEKVSEKIGLEGLKKGETRTFVSRLLEIKDIPEDLVEVLQDRTSGNPYFIEELVKGLVDQGIIVPKDHRWTTRSRLKDLALPNSVKDVITRRLSRVDPRALKTLERAAVLGKHFSLEVLETMAESDEEELVDDLDLLIRSKILCEETGTGTDGYRFTSTALRDAVYEGISNVKRRMLHKRAAKAIEDTYGKGSGEVVYTLAHHYMMAKDTTNSVLYLARAGDLALRAFALDEATKHYRSALEVLGKVDPTPEHLAQKASILLSSGIIHSIIGELDLALKEFDEVQTICGSTGDQKFLAGAYFGLGKVFEQRSDIPSANEKFQKSFDIFKGLSDLIGQSMTLQCVGMCHFRKGEYNKALEVLGRSGELAQQAKAIGELATNTTLKAGVYSELGDFAQSDENYKKAEELAKKDGDPYKIARIYNNWGDLRMREWRYTDALAILEKSLEPAKRSGNLRLSGYAYGNIGECLVFTGDVVKAKPHIERAKAIFEKVDEKLMGSRMIMVEGIIHRKAKEWEKARECARKSIFVAESINMPFAVGEYLMEYGITCKEEGATNEARQVFERALGIFKEIGAGKFLERTEKELKAVDGAEN
jgi:predicted ATPase